MTLLGDKLAALLRSERAQTLAEEAPIALLALVSGGLIGVAVGIPAFAAAGLGMVLTNLATNMASTFLYEAVRPDTDDEHRRIALRDGLKAHDPQIAALVADTLAALGPQLAGALADVQKPKLLPALTAGMQQSGGVLAEVAPQLSAALADPQADWFALQQHVAQRITSVDMSMETSDEAQMRKQKQVVDNATGPVRLSMKASGKSVQEGNEQRVTGVGAATPSGTSTPNPTASTEPQHLHALLATTIARLQVRELQQAQYGIDTPPHVTTERAQLQAEVTRLRAQLGL